MNNLMSQSMDGRDIKGITKLMKPALESPFKGNMMNLRNNKNEASLDR